MDSNVREIVSLHVGHYSNFIGSHWLNLQEASFTYDDSASTDINHDYLFREGKLHNNEVTYTPRLLIIDAKGSLRSLPQAGTLYNPPCLNFSTSQALWSGNVDVINQSPEDKNDYLKYLEAEDLKYAKNIDEDKDICSVADESISAESGEAESKIFDLADKVNVWSDFLGTNLHHKSIYLLNEVCHQDICSEESEGATFGWGFQEGVNAFKNENAEEEINDRIRLLAESCGSLQGFHMLCDGHDGMGGVGSMIAELIADDYSSKDLFSFISHPPHFKPKTVFEHAHHSTYLTNLIQCYSELYKNSTLLLPLSLRGNIYDINSEVVRWPYITYKESCPYETSSIFATFLETITVPWRSKSNPIPMTHIADILTPLQRKVVGAGLSFPIGLEEEMFLNDWFMENQQKEIHNKIGLRSIGLNNSDLPRFGEIHSVRGISQSSLERITNSKKRMKFANAWQLFEHHLSEEDGHLNRKIYRLVSGVNDSLKTVSPYPHIFNKKVNTDGYIKNTSEISQSIVEKTSSIANMYQGDDIAMGLKAISNIGIKINVSKIPQLLIGSLEKEVWSNAMEEFLTLTNNYEDKSSIFNDNSDSD